MDNSIMNQPAKLERYSFLWSQARLVVAAVALLLGGIPPALLFFPSLYGLVGPLLTLSWVASGVTSGYLLYRWNTSGKKVFGGNAPHDRYAFFVSVVSGLNLGITGLFGRNPGMTILSGRFIFVIVAVIYLVAAYHLQQRWNASGQKVF